MTILEPEPSFQLSQGVLASWTDMGYMLPRWFFMTHFWGPSSQTGSDLRHEDFSKTNTPFRNHPDLFPYNCFLPRFSARMGHRQCRPSPYRRRGIGWGGGRGAPWTWFTTFTQNQHHHRQLKSLRTAIFMHTSKWSSKAKTRLVITRRIGLNVWPVIRSSKPPRPPID